MQPRWKQRSESTHRKHLAELKPTSSRILFLGDSMMERWKTTGAEFWSHDLKPFKIFNGGVGGDKLENLLWRIYPDKGLIGLLDDTPFEQIFLMIGSNNLERDSPEKIINGIIKIIDAIFRQQDKLTNGHLKRVIVYGLTARTDVEQSKIDTVNALIRSYVREHPDRLEYRFFGDQVDTEDANFDDNVHLSKIGYQIWLEYMKADLH